MGDHKRIQMRVFVIQLEALSQAKENLAVEWADRAKELMEKAGNEMIKSVNMSAEYNIGNYWSK